MDSMMAIQAMRFEPFEQDLVLPYAAHCWRERN
jgi:hypothetical protein